MFRKTAVAAVLVVGAAGGAAAFAPSQFAGGLGSLGRRIGVAAQSMVRGPRASHPLAKRVETHSCASARTLPVARTASLAPLLPPGTSDASVQRSCASSVPRRTAWRDAGSAGCCSPRLTCVPAGCTQSPAARHHPGRCAVLHYVADAPRVLLCCAGNTARWLRAAPLGSGWV
jgi:hypothetical protein